MPARRSRASGRRSGGRRTRRRTSHARRRGRRGRPAPSGGDERDDLSCVTGWRFASQEGLSDGKSPAASSVLAGGAGNESPASGQPSSALGSIVLHVRRGGGVHCFKEDRNNGRSPQVGSVRDRHNQRVMEAERIPREPEAQLEDDVLRFYKLAKKAEWMVRDLPWGEQPPIPELRGSPQRQARRRDVWRSVVTQQLQADELAVEMATQLFALAGHPGRSSTTRRWCRTSASHRGLAPARRAGRRPRGERPVPRQDRAARDRGGHARGEGLPDAGVLRAADHPQVQADREAAPGTVLEDSASVSRSTTGSTTEPASPTSGSSCVRREPRRRASS